MIKNLWESLKRGCPSIFQIAKDSRSKIIKVEKSERVDDDRWEMISIEDQIKIVEKRLKSGKNT